MSLARFRSRLLGNVTIPSGCRGLWAVTPVEHARISKTSTTLTPNQPIQPAASIANAASVAEGLPIVGPGSTDASIM